MLKSSSILITGGTGSFGHAFVSMTFEVVIYEPVLTEQGDNKFFHSKVIDSLNDFKQISDVIVANTMVSELSDVKTRSIKENYLTQINQ
jgi:FlaA1/EpsC-like NDP-sugar epimerase